MNNVLVLGCQRSGTSVVMQSLAIAGYPVFGLKYPPYALEEWNPKGFYEFNKALVPGNLYDYLHGVAIKFFLSPVTNKQDESYTKAVEWADKIIYCQRPVSAIVESLKTAELTNSTDERTEARVIRQQDKIILAPLEKVLTVNYDNFLLDPSKTLTDIFNHIQYSPTAEQISSAVANVGK